MVQELKKNVLTLVCKTHPRHTDHTRNIIQYTRQTFITPVNTGTHNCTSFPELAQHWGSTYTENILLVGRPAGRGWLPRDIDDSVYVNDHWSAPLISFSLSRISYSSELTADGGRPAGGFSCQEMAVEPQSSDDASQRERERNNVIHGEGSKLMWHHRVRRFDASEGAGTYHRRHHGYGCVQIQLCGSLALFLSFIAKTGQQPHSPTCYD